MINHTNPEKPVDLGWFKGSVILFNRFSEKSAVPHGHGSHGLCLSSSLELPWWLEAQLLTPHLPRKILEPSSRSLRPGSTAYSKRSKQHTQTWSNMIKHGHVKPLGLASGGSSSLETSNILCVEKFMLNRPRRSVMIMQILVGMMLTFENPSETMLRMRICSGRLAPQDPTRKDQSSEVSSERLRISDLTLSLHPGHKKSSPSKMGHPKITENCDDYHHSNGHIVL